MPLPSIKRILNLDGPHGLDQQEDWKARLQFAGAFLKNPLDIGAILPSSAALARAITQGLEPGTGKILELGSGTGVFTQQLITLGFAPDDLILVERNPAMAATLCRRFPQACVLQAPAQALGPENTPDFGHIGATICGLPLRNMGHNDHHHVLKATFQAMGPGGVLYLFTYGLRCPIAPQTLEAQNLTSTLRHIVLKNIPPASVYCISRR